ncbi:serine-type D-Ala-D-Ala carboxypeptidase [Sphaerotilus natans subsp. natans DSM 6575]|uniref:serine-type D-Ala-D-Ala carboxypeptidase n=1 Tax=Sphaerotilus natans subsp. natans DSM 6575 TaxID=1286631 RepID=A0A059KPN9_9BURK|nr:D-alanyl-D-alanine carboxypeptidase family protein [Sphaerotilus natans]KDB53048.1 serine-type D-Ala-D-Ala carboxypeptidase [Sphaerotilus natans subsp. natans DSM 6575]SIQ29330.1 D-alanyl-D-alanine carboxypeptidase (penicillin-binding protein 5/6) [Sphaerotilus natans]
MKRLLASLALAALLPQTVSAQALPQPPEIAARAYVLLDLSTNQPLAARDADVTVEPASLTKLMTAYLVFQALRDKKLALDQELTVSERAWRTGMTDASRMYIQVGNKVKVEDLIKGMIVQSGNDATVLLAEAVGGSVENFVAMMNRQAQAFGLKVSQFRNPEGLPAPGHVSTVRELGIIATRLLQDFPGEVKFYSIKEFTFNKITQQNRNLLLWRDPSVDGLKTGYTDAAGYCLIATAKRDLPNGSRRLLSVVVGASSKESRAVESQKLLNWGYSSWDAVKVYDARQVIASAEVWKGAASTAKIGTQVPVSVAVPRGEAAQVKTQLVRTDPLIAPLSQGQQVGTLKVLSGTRVLAEVPVTVLEPVAQAGMFGRAWDQLRLWLR